MGWLWGSDQNKDESKENTKPFSFTDRQRQAEKEQQLPGFQSFSNFVSTSARRECKSDPQDPKFMICKEISNNGKDTSQKTERIPVGQRNTFFEETTSFDSFFKSFFEQNPVAILFPDQTLDPNQPFNQNPFLYPKGLEEHFNHFWGIPFQSGNSSKKEKQSPTNYQRNRKYANQRQTPQKQSSNNYFTTTPKSKSTQPCQF